jgi:farnesyl-diphosphate farnesyltransferase
MDASLRAVRKDLEKNVLKGVSRSFYLSLRLLPAPMRKGAGLGYLLARTSDTLADTAGIPTNARLQCLDEFAQAVADGTDVPRWPAVVLDAVVDPRERWLLECSGAVFKSLEKLPTGEAHVVREVLAVIIGGQKLDLERFGAATGENPVALPDDRALDDYAWRVAGCVGEFWTKLGFETLGTRFSSASQAELLRRGRAYGIGLQLVNILRDLPEDMASGRCYLPVADLRDREALMICHAKWLAQASRCVAEGRVYAATLGSRRLRAASVLPSLIAEKTLALLQDATWETLQTRIKIPRRVVYRVLGEAFLGSP